LGFHYVVSSEPNITADPDADINLAASIELLLSVYALPAYNLWPFVVVGVDPSIVIKTSLACTSKETALVLTSSSAKETTVDASGVRRCEVAVVVGFMYKFVTNEFIIVLYHGVIIGLAD
jgi:hypothetical protein